MKKPPLDDASSVSSSWCPVSQPDSVMNWSDFSAQPETESESSWTEPAQTPQSWLKPSNPPPPPPKAAPPRLPESQAPVKPESSAPAPLAPTQMFGPLPCSAKQMFGPLPCSASVESIGFLSPEVVVEQDRRPPWPPQAAYDRPRQPQQASAKAAESASAGPSSECPTWGFADLLNKHRTDYVPGLAKA
jgi:hypothetical protein